MPNYTDYVYLLFLNPQSIIYLQASANAEYKRKEKFTMSDTNVVHELTMLYLHQKDISALTPEQLLDEYKKVYREIKSKKSEKYGANWTV